MKKHHALIFLSGGKGLRMGGDIPKQYRHLQDLPIALHSFKKFLDYEPIKEIVVVAESNWHELFLKIFNSNCNKNLKFAKPGKERFDSVRSGLAILSPLVDLVAIHDSARPFVNHSLIDDVFKQARTHQAACPALPMKNTIKQVCREKYIQKTVDRSTLFESQTPQVVDLNLLKEGFTLLKKKNLSITDDVNLVEILGIQPKITQGCEKNIKITTEHDLHLANFLMENEI